jgi:hypothetical protein
MSGSAGTEPEPASAGVAEPTEPRASTAFPYHRRLLEDHGMWIRQTQLCRREKSVDKTVNGC